MAVIKWYADNILKEASKVQRRAIKDACAVVTHSVKTNFPDTGMTGEAHSSPGGIPYKQTTTLARSIGYEIVSDDEGHVGPRLGFKSKKKGKDKSKKESEEAANYGGWLELGTPKMAPRPYLRPALNRSRAKILRIFKNEFEGKVVGK